MGYSAKLTLVDDDVGLIFMASIFCILDILAVILRFRSRQITRSGIGVDDWLALVALVFTLALNGVFIGGTAQGAITGHSPIVNNWPVTTELEHLAQKYKYGFQTTEKIAFGLIKTSILLLWKRIFGRTKRFAIPCWIMIAVVLLWSVAFLIATVFQCGTDWPKNWAPIGIFLTQCSDTLLVLTVFTATDLFTDFVIMFMPVPIIWTLQMPFRRKVGVTGIFMVGLLTIGAGIARMYIYLVTSYDKETNPDFIADFTLFILWSEIEVNVAMLVCCMPTWGPVLSRSRQSLSDHMRSMNASKWAPLPDSWKSKDSATDFEIPTRPILPNTPSGDHQPRPGLSTLAVSNLSRDSSEDLTYHSGILARTEILMTNEPWNSRNPNGTSQQHYSS